MLKHVHPNGGDSRALSEKAGADAIAHMHSAQRTNAPVDKPTGRCISFYRCTAPPGVDHFASKPCGG
jgi:hypothetical protein